ncbi:hypothetical protein [Prevotella sp. FD3004]|nr:hypothetical protein [Prevotella sp. FD3004]
MGVPLLSILRTSSSRRWYLKQESSMNTRSWRFTILIHFSSANGA